MKRLGLVLLTVTCAAMAITGAGTAALYNKANLKGESEMSIENGTAEGYKKVEETVVGGYQKIEDTVVNGYKKIEESVVGGYQKIEDGFVDRFLKKDGETVEEAKERMKQ